MNAPAHLPDRHIDASKRRLAHLAGLAAKTEEAERRILAAATHRIEAVEADLGVLRPRVQIDPAAAGRYQELTLERGQLQVAIARAREVLR